MAELRNEKTATPETAELDNAELLGFEWLERERDEEARTEQAIGLAFNKRGLLGGEGPEPKISSHALKDPPASAVIFPLSHRNGTPNG